MVQLGGVHTVGPFGVGRPGNAKPGLKLKFSEMPTEKITTEKKTRDECRQLVKKWLALGLHAIAIGPQLNTILVLGAFFFVSGWVGGGACS